MFYTMNRFVFACPVCGQPLDEQNGAMRCTSRHSFDIASAGYVNLLRTQSSRTHGDDGVMVRARRDFLARGYYEPIAEAVANTCVKAFSESGELSGQALRMLDIGCGEGYYTEKVTLHLKERGADISAAGIDISRDAIRLAAKASRMSSPAPVTSYAVASAFKLPVADGYADIALSVFAPFPEQEIKRVLKQSGYAVRVYPLARHLWELKCLLYDEPRENDDLDEPKNLKPVGHTNLEYFIDVSGDDLINLFFMTPYAHRTPREAAERLNTAKLPKLSIAVGISVYASS